MPFPSSLAGPPRRSLGKLRIAGFDFDNLSEQEVVSHIIGESQADRGGWVVTPNIDICRKAQRDPALRALLREATLTVPDGMPLIWAAAIKGEPFAERVTGSSLIFTLAAAAAASGRSVYLLGGDADVPAGAGANLAGRYPGLKVAGTDAPPFGFEKSARTLTAVKARVRDAGPDIVFVGLGCPKQEQLIHDLMPDLPATWFIGCGAAITIAAGAVPRAPRRLQGAGLEWAYRLLKEPRRLFRRYLVDDLPFAVGLLLAIAIRRAARRPEPCRN